MELRSSTEAPTIPSEIWMHVTQFVPDADLCSMFSINRVFFQLAMDARYHELTLQPDSDSDAEALRRRQRVRDPSIAHRVRSLYINLVFGDEIFYPRHNKEGNLRSGSDISMLEGIPAMTETVTYLTNVTELTVHMLDCPRELQLVSLFHVAWKSFGASLRKLSFDVSLKYLSLLLSTAHGLLVLKDLNVEISKLSTGKTDDQVLNILLAPFVNKVAPNLHSLSLCISGVDVTPLFLSLEKVPNLKRMRIRINHFENLVEPFCITRFVCDHATTLRHLNWDQQYQNSDEQNLIDLLRATNLEEVFLNLYTLRIRVPPSPGGFTLVAQHIRCSTRTLASLELLGYNMTYAEVNTVVSIFAPSSAGNLRELRILVQFFSPEIVLLLAQTLPFLQKLSIYAQRIAGHEVGKGTSDAIEADGNENRAQKERVNAATFARTVRTYNISSWALRDITIRAASVDFDLSKKLMRFLAECVPSVQKFNGKDKDSYPGRGGNHEQL